MLAEPMGAPLRRAACIELLGLLVVAWLALGAAPARAATQASDGAQRAERADRAINGVRVGIAAAALALWASGWGAARAGRPAPPPLAASARRVALGTLAAAAFASNFNFFVWTGLHKHELFHYYLGSKYFPELGYFRLYECSVAALYPSGEPLPAELAEITDLRTKRRRPAAEVLAAAPPCRDDFSPARWAAFQEDAAAFRRILGERGLATVLRDHGYNPSPVWTLFGRPIASLVPARPAGLWLIARIDLWLLAGLFAAVGWAFGFEALCLAAIAWGACGHTRYQWTGDAFLRQLWLAASIAAICLVRKRRQAAGGALLALASLERVFPVLLFGGWGLQQLGRAVRARRLDAAATRLALGALLAGALLAAAGTAVAGRGAGVWREFADNMAAMTEFTPRNGLGLKYLLEFRASPPAGVEIPKDAEGLESAIQDYKRETLASRRWLYGGALALFGLGFARAAWADPGRLADWEALAMGALLIPIVTMPASYYLGFALAAAPLATRRPRIGTALLLAVLGWAAALLAYQERALAFAWSSALLLALCAWVLVELQLPARGGLSAPADPVMLTPPDPA
jgi:hypothetical protein